MNRIQALILDAGGVLIKPLHGDWNIPANYRELLGDCSADIPGERWKAACRAEANILREDVIVPDTEREYALRLEFLGKLAARMDWALTDAQLQALAKDFTYNIDRYDWYGDTRAWLDRWQRHGLRLGMLSDAMPSFRQFVHVHGLEDIFEAIVISTEIGACKPDPRMYGEICARMQIAPANCLFVDDRECNLRGAIDFGMRAVQMCRDDLAGWDGPQVHNLEELNAYLEGLL